MEEYALAAPVWSAPVDPHVICARAYSCDAETPLGLNIEEFDHRVALSPFAEHVLVRTSDTTLRIDVVEGTVLDGPVVLEPCVALDKLTSQIRSIRKLDAMLRGWTPPRERDSRLPRLVLALRALDGRAEGASLRELAFRIFGAKDWPGDGDNVKSHVRRFVKLSEQLVRAGPRGVLARET